MDSLFLKETEDAKALFEIFKQREQSATEEVLVLKKEPKKFQPKENNNWLDFLHLRHGNVHKQV